MFTRLGGGAPGSTYRILLDPAPTEGGGTKTDPPAADPTKGYEAALKAHGDNASAFARQVYTDLESARRELAAANGKLPTAGAVVLTGDDAQAWEAFKALGKPDEVKVKLTERDTFEGTIKARERTDLRGEAAKAYGFDADVLEQLAGPDLKIVVRDGTRNGKPAKVADVMLVGEDGKETPVPLDKHAEKAWAKFLPSLKAGAPDNRPNGGPTRRNAPPAPLPGQGQDTRTPDPRGALKVPKF